MTLLALVAFSLTFLLGVLVVAAFVQRRLAAALITAPVFAWAYVQALTYVEGGNDTAIVLVFLVGESVLVSSGLLGALWIAGEEDEGGNGGSGDDEPEDDPSDPGLFDDFDAQRAGWARSSPVAAGR